MGEYVQSSLTDAETANIALFVSTGGSWAVNGSDDPVTLSSAAGDVQVAPNKDDILRLQADGSYLIDSSGQTSGATGAESLVGNTDAPVVIYEIGEKGSSTRLVDYNGNYVMLFVLAAMTQPYAPSGTASCLPLRAAKK